MKNADKTNLSLFAMKSEKNSLRFLISGRRIWDWQMTSFNWKLLSLRSIELFPAQLKIICLINPSKYDSYYFKKFQWLLKGLHIHDIYSKMVMGTSAFSPFRLDIWSIFHLRRLNFLKGQYHQTFQGAFCWFHKSSR